jgi:hypothetical protein
MGSSSLSLSFPIVILKAIAEETGSPVLLCCSSPGPSGAVRHGDLLGFRCDIFQTWGVQQESRETRRLTLRRQECEMVMLLQKTALQFLPKLNVH